MSVDITRAREAFNAAFKDYNVGPDPTDGDVNAGVEYALAQVLAVPDTKQPLTHWVEWRLCGEHPRRGLWHGAWRTTDPLSTASGEYEVKGYIKDGNTVRVERREVWESDVSSVNANEMFATGEVPF